MAAIQPTKVSLDVCSINDINYYEGNAGGDERINFHVKELRVYEDICKFYFTAQLVIETEQNAHEWLLGPTVPVRLVFDSPRTDGGRTRGYNKRFKILSYESRPLSGGTDARMEHTLQLISQEFYNDRHNTVMQGFSMIPGTAAAAAIHGQYIQTEGGLRIPVPSLGPIANPEVPHQARNMKPVKAIHDILDRCVFAGYPSCAPIYYKDVNGYVMAPLQFQLENGPMAGSWVHKLGAGNELNDVLQGYENAIHFRPMAPPGEANADSSSMVLGMLNAAQFFDMKNGQTQNVPGAIGAVLGLPFINKVPNLKARVAQMLGEASRGSFGSRNMMAIIDDLMQARSQAKHGPGGFNQAQEVFLTALTYSQKYWLSVPSQSGLNVTCGNRVNIVYPVVQNGRAFTTQKTLFVPRLIHELKFTEGQKREPLVINGTTDMFCVLW